MCEGVVSWGYGRWLFSSQHSSPAGEISKRGRDKNKSTRDCLSPTDIQLSLGVMEIGGGIEDEETREMGSEKGKSGYKQVREQKMEVRNETK